MPIDIQEYQQLKRKAEAAKAAADRAAGKAEAAMAELRATYGCNTLEEAEQKHAVYQEEADALERAYNAEKAKFEEEWKTYIGQS